MAKKKKPESMLTRQRRLLREQRAKKAAAKKAQEQAAKAPKKLPGKGKTTASSNRAKLQRGLRRDRLARRQLETFARGMRKTLKQSAAADKLKKAAKGTKGKTVRTAQGKGDLVKRPNNLPASQRVEKVKVKVDQPKQLPSAKTKSPKALPKGKTQPKGQPSARRAQAAAKANRAAQGTKGGTRVGQPKGAANRFYGADRVNAAVDRAKASTGKGRLASGARQFAAQTAGFYLAEKMAQTIGKKGQSKMSRLGVQGEVKKSKPKPKTKPAKRGMSNIPPKEGTGKGSPTDKKKPTLKPTLKPAGKVPARTPVSSAPSKPQSLKSAAYAKDARNKEYDRLRKAGKTKEAEALGKKIAADARKKAPKNPFRKPEGKERKDRFSRDVADLKKLRKNTPQKETEKKKKSRALRAGYPGNRNY